jgi:hypothetical protein
VTQHYGDAGSMYADGEGRQKTRSEDYGEHLYLAAGGATEARPAAGSFSLLTF